MLLPTINAQTDAQAHDIRYSLTAIQHHSTTRTGNAKHAAAAAALLRYLSRTNDATTTGTSTGTGTNNSAPRRPSSSIFPGSNGSSNRALPLLSIFEFRVHPKGQGIVCAKQNA